MRAHFLTTTAVMALLSASTVATRAQIWTGTQSTDWFNANNWIGGVPTGLTIASIATINPNPTVVAGGGAIALAVGVGQFGVGNLTIQNGGTLLTFAGGLVGHRQTTVSLGHDLGTPFNFRDTFSGIIRFRPEILRVPGMRATPPVIIDMQQASDGPVR